MNIATTIRDQIRAIDPRALMAWGAKDLVGTQHGLRFKTSGLTRWKGFVHVELDAGADLYNITFFRVRKMRRVVDKHIEGVFAEDLVRLIDEQVG